MLDIKRLIDVVIMVFVVVVVVGIMMMALLMIEFLSFFVIRCSPKSFNCCACFFFYIIQNLHFFHFPPLKLPAAA